MFGLTLAELEQIKKILAKHPTVEQGLIFGSRSAGTYKKNSDIDIALFGDIEPSELASIKSQLEEETTIPYFFDLIDYARIKNSQLKQAIDQNNKVIYNKQ